MHQLFVGIDNANATAKDAGFTYQHNKKAWYAIDPDEVIYEF